VLYSFVYSFFCLLFHGPWTILFALFVARTILFSKAARGECAVHTRATVRQLAQLQEKVNALRQTLAGASTSSAPSASTSRAASPDMMTKHLLHGVHNIGGSDGASSIVAAAGEGHSGEKRGDAERGDAEGEGAAGGGDGTSALVRMFSRRRTPKPAKSTAQAKAVSSALHQALTQGGGAADYVLSGESVLDTAPLLPLFDSSAALGASAPNSPQKRPWRSSSYGSDGSAGPSSAPGPNADGVAGTSWPKSLELSRPLSSIFRRFTHSGRKGAQASGGSGAGASTPD
jgi:hypothetical protein